ncbi:unnamed protein product [Enterobius vermicularis]|uniref:Uncharacterized protein n=1 Tax=Enterobius vermicularis TaxID=51028 RepID=A0A0N4UYC4_ENTVE|nr:unnamed protein product [Enterobius vermicularis]
MRWPSQFLAANAGWQVHFSRERGSIPLTFVGECGEVKTRKITILGRHQRSWSGSNRRPFACEADVITTTPQDLGTF